MKKNSDSDTASQTEKNTAPLDEVLSRPAKIGTKDRAVVSHISGVVIGNLADYTDTGKLRVDYPGNPEEIPQQAVAAAAVTKNDVGKEVALAFVGGDPKRPLVLGLIEHPETQAGQAPSQKGVQVEMDGETLTFTAEKEIVLRCGEASITLTKAGKVLIKGTYTSSHSSGVNRIKGGSVQVN